MNRTLILKLVINNYVSVDEILEFDDQGFQEAQMTLAKCAGQLRTNTSQSLNLEDKNGKSVIYNNITGMTVKWTEIPDLGPRRGQGHEIGSY